MPELPEVEYYRRLALGALDRPVAAVSVPDRSVLAPPLTVPGLRRALVGRRFTTARRRGKLLLLDCGPPGGRAGRARDAAGPTLGLRFGMTGSLLLDDRVAVDRLLYSPGRYHRRWVRWRIRLADGGEMALHDPRRFGRLELDPDEAVLGTDAAAVSPAELRAALSSRAHGGGPPLKARLQDQSRLAGLGNLLCDEILWRAGLSPWRPSGSLTGPELRRLHRHVRATLDQLLVRGGSHTGDLMAERRPGGQCPRDRTALVRTTVAGRTTWWCPTHQI